MVNICPDKIRHFHFTRHFLCIFITAIHFSEWSSQTRIFTLHIMKIGALLRPVVIYNTSQKSICNYKLMAIMLTIVRCKIRTIIPIPSQHEWDMHFHVPCYLPLELRCMGSNTWRRSKKSGIYLLKLFIYCSCLNFRPLQRTLHLMQYTYWDVFSTVQFLNSSILITFSASDIFCFTSSTWRKHFPLRTFFI